MAKDFPSKDTTSQKRRKYVKFVRYVADVISSLLRCRILVKNFGQILTLH